MNAKNVLDKIVTLLSKSETKMTEAKLVDGTVVESPSFDVGQPVEVVTEEGKVPAPDGEHELVLTDESGNEILIKIETEGGVITERENIDITELEEEGEEEVKEEVIEDMVAGLIDALTPDEVSTEQAEQIAEKVLDALEDKIEVLKKRTKLSEETEEVGPLPGDEDFLTKLAYRIEEMEKKMAKFEEALPKMKEEVVDKDADITNLEEEEDEDELPKLNGAPIEKMSKVANVKVTRNAQSSFLSKLYK
jgi:hypothetical protein